MLRGKGKEFWHVSRGGKNESLIEFPLKHGRDSNLQNDDGWVWRMCLYGRTASDPVTRRTDDTHSPQVAQVVSSLYKYPGAIGELLRVTDLFENQCPNLSRVVKGSLKIMKGTQLTTHLRSMIFLEWRARNDVIRPLLILHENGWIGNERLS